MKSRSRSEPRVPYTELHSSRRAFGAGGLPVFDPESQRDRRPKARNEPESGFPTKPIVMQRPACPYPKTVRYAGSGDTNAAASFVCE